MAKSWDKNSIKDLEQVFPKQDHDYFSWLLSFKENITQVNDISLISYMSCMLSFSILNIEKQTESFWEI